MHYNQTPGLASNNKKKYHWTWKNKISATVSSIKIHGKKKTNFAIRKLIKFLDNLIHHTFDYLSYPQNTQCHANFDGLLCKKLLDVGGFCNQWFHRVLLGLVLSGNLPPCGSHLWVKDPSSRGPRETTEEPTPLLLLTLATAFGDKTTNRSKIRIFCGREREVNKLKSPIQMPRARDQGSRGTPGCSQITDLGHQAEMTELHLHQRKRW